MKLSKIYTNILHLKNGKNKYKYIPGHHKMPKKKKKKSRPASDTVYLKPCLSLKAHQIFSYQDIASGITVLWHELWVIDTGCKKNFQETILV